MEKRRFKEIIDELKDENLSDEEKDKLLTCMGFDETIDIKTEVVESFLGLASTDEKIVERYGSQIDEYYKLPMKNRETVCNNVYKCFIRDGHLAIDYVCALIVYEAERVEDQVAVVNAIKRNVKRQPERPRIDFRKAKDE